MLPPDAEDKKILADMHSEALSEFEIQKHGRELTERERVERYPLYIAHSPRKSEEDTKEYFEKRFAYLSTFMKGTESAVPAALKTLPGVKTEMTVPELQEIRSSLIQSLEHTDRLLAAAGLPNTEVKHEPA